MVIQVESPLLTTHPYLPQPLSPPRGGGKGALTTNGLVEMPAGCPRGLCPTLVRGNPPKGDPKARGECQARESLLQSCEGVTTPLPSCFSRRGPGGSSRALCPKEILATSQTGQGLALPLGTGLGLPDLGRLEPPAQEISFWDAAGHMRLPHGELAHLAPPLPLPRPQCPPPPNSPLSEEGSWD